MGRPKGFNREDLLEKAGEVFWEKGFADTSITDLEKATGVAKSGIYSEFKDKDELFTSSLKHYVAKDQALEELSKEPLGFKNIERFFDGKQKCEDLRGCFAGNTMREAAIIPKEANKIIRGYFDEMKLFLENNLRADGFKSNAAIVADMIFSFLLGITLEQNITDPKALEDKIQEFLVTIRALGPKK